jgi:lysozyme family protein
MADFNAFIPILQKIEGGYQNLAGDSGNYNSNGELVGTNHGISAKFYEDIIGYPPTVDDMKAITLDEAKKLYKQYFWDKINGDNINNQSIANIICDAAINTGVGTIGKQVQKVLNNAFGYNLPVTGNILSLTTAAINSVNQSALFLAIQAARVDYYVSLGGQYANSWITRAKSFVFSEKKQSPSGSVA